MVFHKKIINTGLLILFFAVSNAWADGVFTNKERNRHGLTAGEQRQITMEFFKRFGNPTASKAVRTNNPWEAKKQRQENSRTVTWGECRDFALQKRNLCYKQGRDAYNCERLYEARSRKCDSDY